jgi:hypothetical protein
MSQMQSYHCDQQQQSVKQFLELVSMGEGIQIASSKEAASKADLPSIDAFTARFESRIQKIPAITETGSRAD